MMMPCDVFTGAVVGTDEIGLSDGVAAIAGVALRAEALMAAARSRRAVRMVGSFLTVMSEV
jgi:hypothetical protein